ncbi:unnamed protein product [Prunus armeniaca]|uniref:Uncharacterized protein n=1 Tax=Prunus armeniaca TaxID=36596 RepID=A0A6J5THT7_PRUAR|nr:unnamed protein product [Prunus armeniaca]CAB4293117.1 unnamed protein product [Prunus armeniaca]
MRETQTPLKDQARPSKLANRVSKKNIPKKSLNTVFSSVSEDVTVDTSKNSLDSTPVSEISEVNDDGDIAESLMLVPDQALSASSETSFSSDLIPSPEANVDKDEPDHVSLSIGKSSEFVASNFGSVEAEIVAGFLRKARTQVLNAGLDTKSKKLLDAMLEIVIEDFHTLPVKRDRAAELLSAKSYIMIVCFLLWIIALGVLMFSSGGRSNFRGPLPT